MEKPVIEYQVESSLYDADFFEWTQSIADSLRQGRLPESEREHIAEEIADMGKRDRRELISRMTVLVMHLLKWAAQPERREGSSWLATIIEQRREVGYILEASPSLRIYLQKKPLRIFKDAADDAAGETQLPLQQFTPPADFQPTTAHLDRILQTGWLPESVDDLFQ